MLTVTDLGAALAVVKQSAGDQVVPSLPGLHYQCQAGGFWYVHPGARGTAPNRPLPHFLNLFAGSPHLRGSGSPSANQPYPEHDTHPTTATDQWLGPLGRPGHLIRATALHWILWGTRAVAGTDADRHRAPPGSHARHQQARLTPGPALPDHRRVWRWDWSDESDTTGSHVATDPCDLLTALTEWPIPPRTAAARSAVRARSWRQMWTSAQGATYLDISQTEFEANVQAGALPAPDTPSCPKLKAPLWHAASITRLQPLPLAQRARDATHHAW